MSTRATARSTSRRMVTGAIRSLILGVGIVGASVAAVLWLTEPLRVARSGCGRHAAGPRRVPARSGRGRPSPRRALPGIPLYSEDWTEDSGQGLALRFSRPIADPQSLDEVRTSDEGRGQRGIAQLRDELAAVDVRTKAGRRRRSSSRSSSACCTCRSASSSRRDGRFAAAQEADPGAPPMLRANIDALRGVAALRRGEIENCVACCNESSCIFPLAAAAVHRRTVRLARGDRALHRLPRAAARGPGRPLAPERRLHDPGRVPRRRPRGATCSRWAGSASDGEPSDRLANVAARVGLNARGRTMAGGCLVDDFDGDGRLDVFISTTDPDAGLRLLRQPRRRHVRGPLRPRPA